MSPENSRARHRWLIYAPASGIVVLGLIAATRYVDQRRPVQPFSHPRVRWHRTANGGRRAAQVYVLDRLDPADWDFVLIADGGCVLDEYAMEHQLRALSRPRVTATTGSSAGGNDRRPARYAALEGDVVGVRESNAWTLAPADARSAWRGTLQWPVLILYATLYLLVRYAATGRYLIGRPDTTSRRKLWTWLLLTPAEAVYHLGFVVPIKYLALLRLRWPGWAAWRDRGAGRFAMSTAEPGTVYYSGYLPTGRRS